MEPRNVEGGKDPQDAYDDLVNVVEQKLTRAFVGRDQQIRTLIRLLGQVRNRNDCHCRHITLQYMFHCPTQSL